jgi:hypothetical protein
LDLARHLIAGSRLVAGSMRQLAHKALWLVCGFDVKQCKSGALKFGGVFLLGFGGLVLCCRSVPSLLRYLSRFFHKQGECIVFVPVFLIKKVNSITIFALNYFFFF